MRACLILSPTQAGRGQILPEPSRRAACSPHELVTRRRRGCRFLEPCGAYSDAGYPNVYPRARPGYGTFRFAEEPMLRKIVLAHDGSNHADKALDLAITLAKATGSQLEIVNVLSNQSLSQDELTLAET